MGNFIFVASDYEDVSALAIASARLRDHTWALYKRTPNRLSITSGDQVCIYLAGSKKYARAFLAHARVKSINDFNYRSSWTNNDYFWSDLPTKTIDLEEIVFFSPPKPITSLITSLSFIPKSTSWGSALMGGCRKITDGDLSLITMGG